MVRKSEIKKKIDLIIELKKNGVFCSKVLKVIEEVDRNTNQTNIGEIEDHSSEIEGQIDLESKIADLNKISHSDNVVTESEKDSLTFLETKEKELSNILNTKDDNLKNQIEENPFLKKISNLNVEGQKLG